MEGLPEAEVIYDQYKDLVFGYLIRLCHNRDLAEDLTQETFYAAIRQWDTFRKQSNTGTWLCSIARNQYYLLLRKADKQRKLLEKQKEGKKRMRQFGTVQVPSEAFLAVLKMD